MTSLVNAAMNLAVKAHNGQFRKGSKLPYIVHLMESGAIASTMTDDYEIIAAAILHDTVEDTSVTEEQLIKEFSPRVAALVMANTENKRPAQSAEATWETRKSETLAHIPGCTREEQIVILSDKLSNMRSNNVAYKAVGDELWKRFNVKDKAKHKWYYTGIAKALDKVTDTAAYAEYCELCDRIFGVAD